jgi:beta-mannosidase
MAANWCFNEPWPTAANNSLISYPNVPKPGFYEVKNACRPLLASARIPKFRWKAGEIFNAELWMLNDLPADVSAGKITVKIEAGGEKVTLLEWNYNQMAANNNQQGPTVRYKLPSWPVDRIKILLESEGHPELNSQYTLAYKH